MLFVIFIVLIGFNIAGSIRYSNLQAKINTDIEMQQGIQQSNFQLIKENNALKVINRDTIALTKQSQRELKKKFPDLRLTTNCSIFQN